MGVTLSSGLGFCDGGSLVEYRVDAVDLVEKSEAEGRKLRRASTLRRSLIDGSRVHLRFARVFSGGGEHGRQLACTWASKTAVCVLALPHLA